ncbi:hypothetical protein [Clostridium sp. CCUG 7971]|uniref:hypothetical protein n=1 Tax=Clostridium sp. CCUG 7971 TaxID=2811414 RepID=UPI001ABAC60F|nr:hypothetical protein [Clostridium sp. CCUG 7971]MBO3444165.1 hypothetical protein [Clostridium sp. CCUG 7971]
MDCSEKLLNLTLSILSNCEKFLNIYIKGAKCIWLFVSFLALCISINVLKNIFKNLN